MRGKNCRALAKDGLVKNQFIVTDAVDQGLEIMVIVYFCLKFK
jgi:hypothetical protein